MDQPTESIVAHDPSAWPTDPIPELHQQVLGLLRYPLPHRMRRHPQYADPAGRHLDHNSTYSP